MTRSKQPTKARTIFSRATLLAVAAIMLTACAGDVTNPSSSSLAPRDPNKALVGAIDGVYTFVVNPGTSNTLNFGKSYLSVPANAICDLQSSNYGTQYWNSWCQPETDPVTITAIVRNSQTNNPSVEFTPALRFNPNTNVNLYLYVTNAATLSNMTVMKYCSAVGCVDESLTDQSLSTNINTWQGLVWRRIKHFSGYLVDE